MPNETSKSTLTMTDEEHEAFSQRGLAIYEEKLKPLLEPAYNNQFIAIHVESGDYRINRYSGGAMRAAREVHPEGGLVILRIGPEPEWGLAARLLAGQMAAGQQK
jgi:hypothetical protein